MQIIDAQIHRPEPGAGFAGRPESLLLDVSVELAREALDSVGVDVAVIVSAPEFHVRAAELYPDRFMACQPIDLARAIHDPAWLDELLDQVHEQRHVVAARLVVRSWRDGQLFPGVDWPGVARVSGEVGARGLPVFIQAAGRLLALAEIVGEQPGTIFILDHLGLDQHPSAVSGDPWQHLPDVLAMAAFPNVAVKATGVNTLAGTPYPFPDIWPGLRSVIDAFGADRVMWGSDFTRLRFAPRSTTLGPRAGWFGSYAESLGYVRYAGQLSEEEREWLLSGTVRAITRWPS